MKKVIMLALGVWQFCGFLFWPQWGKIKDTNTNYSN